MNHVLCRQLRCFVLVFFDDILIYNRTWEEHLQHWEEVVHILEEQQLYAKLSKCEFGLTKMLHLGHVSGKDGVKLATALTDLTKRGAFVWTQVAKEAFTRLKRVMSSFPILSLRDFTRQFVLECDASGEGIGTVLTQRDHHIVFESRKLRRHEQLYYNKEMLAVMHALAKFRQYLVGNQFKVKTDHNSLCFLLEEQSLEER
eukprot:PITA_30102